MHYSEWNQFSHLFIVIVKPRWDLIIETIEAKLQMNTNRCESHDAVW